MSSLRCLVIGGSGFLGQELCQKLVSSGFQVRSISRGGQPKRKVPWHTNVEWIEASVDSPAAFFALQAIDFVYHVASTTHPSTSNVDMPYDLESNTLATVRLLIAACKLPIQKFIFVSSGGTVYGVPSQHPIPETHATLPLCAYGIHKLAIEKYLHLFDILHGLKSTVLRVSNIYGENQSLTKPLGAISHFTARILQGRPIEIWGDGSVIRDYIHVSDVVDALMKAATYDDSAKVYNIGSGKGLSLNELLELIKKHCVIPFEVIYRPSRAFDVKENVLNISLAMKELSWSPKNDLELTLKAMLRPKM